MTDSRDQSEDTAADPSDALEELAETVSDARGADEDARGADEEAGPFTAADLDYADSLEELADETTSADPVEDADQGAAFGGVGATEHVLVLGPLRGDASERSCADLLAGRRESSPEGVLFVAVTGTADDRLAVFREHSGVAPRRIAVVRTGSTERKRTRSTGAAGGPEEFLEYGVDDPSDLTRLGITITRCLNERPDPGSPAAVCLHSLTGLLQYVDRQRLFRFVHILQAKLEAANATAHFHMDPESHSRETVTVFRTLFDAVVEVGDDGSVSVASADP